MERGRHHLETFGCTEDGDRRGDNSVAVQQGSAHQTEHYERHEPSLGELVALLEDKREQREDTALAAVVGAHDEDDVLDADRQDQRPENERHDAVYVLWSPRETVLHAERLAKSVERAGTDIAKDNAQRQQRELAQTAPGRFFGRRQLRYCRSRH